MLKAVQHEVVDDKALITKYRSHVRSRCLFRTVTFASDLLSANRSPCSRHSSSRRWRLRPIRLPKPTSLQTRAGYARHLACCLESGLKNFTLQQKKQAERVQDLERQVEEFRSLFLTSQNIEKRRLSVRSKSHLRYASSKLTSHIRRPCHHDQSLR